MTEFGIVEFFAAKRGQMFGKIKVLDEYGRVTDERVFFHLNDGKAVERMEGRVAIFTQNVRTNTGHSTRLKPPGVGEYVVFERRAGNKGDKARPWGYLPEGEEIPGREIVSGSSRA